MRPSPTDKKPALKISVLSDYICPFCFIGNLRLKTLREAYELKVNWCFIEIHPETPPLGHSVKQLNYEPAQWDEMMMQLQSLADEEKLSLYPQTITTNSRKALLLSEASKQLGADAFYPLHDAIFEAYFIDGKNIGDENVLRDIAKQQHIPDDIINQAWSENYSDGPANEVPPCLLPYLQYAGYLNATSVPTFIIGKQILSGAVSTARLLDAARLST